MRFQKRNNRKMFFSGAFFPRWLTLFMIFLFSASFASEEIEEKPLVVLITSYKNSRWYERNLRSVFTQNYSNYRVIYIDDCSPDKTGELVEKYIAKCNQNVRVQLIRNEVRVGALANIFKGVHLCDDDEIVVSLDGDDWFADRDVLSKINEAYQDPDVWLTHGSMIEYPNNSAAWCIPVPDEIIQANLFRTYRCPSHLRTFYAWLFKLIHEEDLKYNGDFFIMTWDQAMMFPMIEMAGGRHKYIADILYVYNIANAINDNKVNAQLQRDLEDIIRRMPPYQRLDKRPQEKK